ncbi:MAG: 3-isopropylmalate dehydratase [Candidatus Lokiarchaeota archaeon]|nr:3-isopropylmalate dehydratase [Candidatus Lokiarchaeota archaeon]
MENIEGEIYILGDDINTDDIVPSYTLTMRDPNEMTKHVLEFIEPNFAQKAARISIIIGGHNFGTGSSREEAVNVFKILGIKAIIAKSFSRIYYRNLINNGIAGIICEWDEATFSDGDQVQISIENGIIFNLSKDLELPYKKLPQFLKEILESGGILNQLKEKLKLNQ